MPRIACAQRVLLCWKLAPRCCMLLFLFLGDAAASFPMEQAQDSRGKRAGDVAGLEDGRISLARVSSMLTSSIHVEVRVAFSRYIARFVFLGTANEKPSCRLETCQRARPHPLLLTTTAVVRIQVLGRPWIF